MKIKYLGVTCMALLLSIGMFSTTAFAYASEAPAETTQEQTEETVENTEVKEENRQRNPSRNPASRWSRLLRMAI